tara:strand:- start:253 stop:456 length:204 start_codon:yes stop_codon:yes gene_type:complete
MTELVDEFFEHPKPRNDDLMDGLYYADYYAKKPKSGRTKLENLGNDKNENRKFNINKAYNWLTGARA